MLTDHPDSVALNDHVICSWLWGSAIWTGSLGQFFSWSQLGSFMWLQSPSGLTGAGWSGMASLTCLAVGAGGWCWWLAGLLSPCGPSSSRKLVCASSPDRSQRGKVPWGLDSRTHPISLLLYFLLMGGWRPKAYFEQLPFPSVQVCTTLLKTLKTSTYQIMFHPFRQVTPTIHSWLSSVL